MKATQAKHIPDDAIVDLVRSQGAKSSISWPLKPGQRRWVMRGEIEAALPDVPPKVVLAKIRSLLKRKLLGGCGCGCRGDLVLPEDR